MTETLQTTYAPASLHAMDLAVATDSSGFITVAAGSCVANGVKHTLADIETFRVSAKLNPTEIMGYLVLDTRNGGALRVFVDEIEMGVSDVYDFSRQGDYTLLFSLFQLILPANTTDLTGVDYVRWVVTENT